MASTDATPFPKKNVAYRVTFPIYDADGDLVTGAAGLDSEVSKDAGTFADCTNEATEIATSSGMYYLDLTSTEMNADTVAIIVKTSTSGAKTTALVLYPEEGGDIRVDVTMISGDATAADNAESFFDGTGYAGTNNVIPTVTTVNGLANNAITANSIAANAITAAKIATDAIDADAIAADAVTEIQSGLSTLNAAGVRSAVGLASANLDTQLTAIDDFLDTEIAAIKAVTDLLPNGGALTSLATAASITSLDGKIGTPSNLNGGGATLAGNLSDIEAQTDDIGAAGAGLTAIPWNANWDAEVQSEVDDALIAKGLDHLVFTSVTGTDIADNSIIAKMVSKSATADWDSFANTTDALEALRDRGDAAWTTATGFSTHTAADVWAVGTRLLTAGTNIVLAKGVGVTGFNDLDAAGVRTAVGLASANLDTQLAAIDDFLDTEIAAIKAKTDNLPTDPADASDIAAAFAAASTKLDTIAGYLDTEIAAIKAKTDNLPASPAATGDAMTLTSGERNAVADAFLDRNMATGTDSGSSTVRTVRQALRFNRNKVEISGGTLTTYKEDDATASWTAAITQTAGDPVSAMDPAGP